MAKKPERSMNVWIELPKPVDKDHAEQYFGRD